MGKISIGIRGWRFDEDEVFDDAGNIRPLNEMDEDTRNRLVRLSAVLGEPCSACWLIHGEDNLEKTNAAEIVYGEPLAEVILCSEHEPDFLYWFREAGGEEYAGTGQLQEEFHEWFADGGRAPEGYAGLEYVDEAPDELPEVPADPADRDGIPEVEEQVAAMEKAERDALDLDLDDLDV
ncbi:MULTISPECIES: hypothetical protein [Salinibaculum]|uniref:hypothetical protein n=1 Tax=Salinibaculum TaxID=2732368 RepID=UPI0030D0BF38